MGGRIYLRGRIYWIAYYHAGKEVRESSGSSNQKDAEGLLQRRQDELGAERLGVRPFQGPVADRLMVDDLITDIETAYTIEGKLNNPTRAHIKQLRRLFQGIRANEATASLLREYVKRRQGEGAADGTIARELVILRRAFQVALASERVVRVPVFPKLSSGRVREGFFEPGDFQAVAEHLPSYLQDLARFAYLTGWRKGEVRQLRWEYVDLTGGVIRLPGALTKTKKPRLLSLVGQLREIIERRKAEQVYQDTIVPWVFHRRGKAIGKNFYRAWQVACERAGLRGKLFHDFRRTAVRNLIHSGVPEKVAMEITGHKTRAIFDRYHIVRENDIKQALETVQGYLSGQPHERSVLPIERLSNGSG